MNYGSSVAPTKAQTLARRLEETRLPVLFAVADVRFVIPLMVGVWESIIVGLVLWWSIHAIIKYRVFRYIVLTLFVLTLAGLAMLFWTTLLVRPRPAPAAPAVPSAAASPAEQPEPLAKAGQAPATIRVRLPSDADLWVGGVRTTSSGPSRVFMTPPLDSGKLYNYGLRARWVNNGVVVEQTRHVKVKAGGKAEVDFTRPVSAPAP